MTRTEAPDWPEIDELMSNFDGEVDEAVAERLKVEEVLAAYPGWEFHARCWYEDGQYHAEVRRYHAVVAILSAPTPAELRREVSADWGWG